MSNLVEFNQFQFYLSSIKSFLQTSALDILVSFNSTLVQLKDVSRRVLSGFQGGFNSTLVQLKANVILHIAVFIVRFNSTLVQLKGLSRF